MQRGSAGKAAEGRKGGSVAAGMDWRLPGRCRSPAGGQLGRGSTQSSEEPVEVAGLRDVVSIAAGLVHTCAATAGGEVLCWGGNGFGQLGDACVEARPLPARVVMPE